MKSCWPTLPTTINANFTIEEEEDGDTFTHTPASLEEADKVSGAAVDWDLLQVIDLTKPENASKALDNIFQDFYLADEENFLTLAEFITSFW